MEKKPIHYFYIEQWTAVYLLIHDVSHQHVHALGTATIIFGVDV